MALRLSAQQRSSEYDNEENEPANQIKLHALLEMLRVVFVAIPHTASLVWLVGRSVVMDWCDDTTHADDTQ